MKDPSTLVSRFDSIEVVLPCVDLHATQSFFVERLSFELESVFPADDVAVAVVTGYGMRLRLERGQGDGAAIQLRFLCDDPPSVFGGAGELVAPNGTRCVWASERPPLQSPPLEPAVTVCVGGARRWVAGRAGMQYRDLIPGRLGGGFIASHIRIEEGGRVPDYVHHHHVLFQTIYCLAGWVRVVYEDQGEPFVLEPGDCVVQPPHIRHRVLECGAGLEVLEVSCPAEHVTYVDRRLCLPNGSARAERMFEGQQFCRHVARDAPWTLLADAGFEVCETDIETATRGAGRVRTVRRGPAPLARHAIEPADFGMGYLLAGTCVLRQGDGSEVGLARGDAFAATGGGASALVDCSVDFAMVEVGMWMP